MTQVQNGYQSLRILVSVVLVLSMGNHLPLTKDEKRRAELADFLHTRRVRLSPSDVGLPHRMRRRVAGLRREEVAELADIMTPN